MLYYDFHSIKVINTACAIISCALSFLVLLTYASFKSIRNKVFMLTIFNFSLCDFIANASVLSGNPSDRILCFMQGMIQQYFYPASWYWTACLTFLLYSVIFNEKIRITNTAMYSICYILPFIGLIIPLSTDTYSDNANDDDWCWLNPRSSSAIDVSLNNAWIILTFYIPIFGCFLIMTGWYLLIMWKVKSTGVQFTASVQKLLKSIIFYPFVLFICWFPNAVQTITLPDSKYPANCLPVVLINSLSILQGGFTALLFFYNSKESRKLWKNLFINLYAQEKEIKSPGDTDRASLISIPDIDFPDDSEIRESISDSFHSLRNRLSSATKVFTSIDFRASSIRSEFRRSSLTPSRPILNSINSQTSQQENKNFSDIATPL
eukprot:gene9536-12844_t